MTFHVPFILGQDPLVYERERSGQVLFLLAEQRTGGWPVDLLCSRNARPEKALVGRAQWEAKQATLP
jgi:hypothetical protein